VWPVNPARSTQGVIVVALSIRRTDTVRVSTTPTGLAIGAGAIMVVVAGVIAAAVPPADAGWRFAVMAIVVGLFAAISLDQVALAAVAVLAFAVYNGFLEDRFGQLSWHGADDLWRLLLLVIVAAFGLAAGEAVRFVHRMRTDWRTRASAGVHDDLQRDVPVAEPMPASEDETANSRTEWLSDTALALRFGVTPPPRNAAHASRGHRPDRQ
jgi:hypothetical protein